MWRVADAGGTGSDDAGTRDEHFGSVAALEEPQFGNYELEKMPRMGAGVDLGDGHGVEWEYRLTRRRRVVRKRVSVARVAAASALEKSESGLSFAASDISSAATIC